MLQTAALPSAAKSLRQLENYDREACGMHAGHVISPLCWLKMSHMHDASVPVACLTNGHGLSPLRRLEFGGNFMGDQTGQQDLDGSDSYGGATQ